MNKELKIKIIIFSVIGLLVLIAFFFMFRAFGSKEKKVEEVTKVHSDVDAEFTLDDMLRVNDKTRPRKDQTAVRRNTDLSGGTTVYQEEDPDVLRLQAALRENRAKEDSTVLENKRRMQSMLDSIRGGDPPTQPVIRQPSGIKTPIPEPEQLKPKEVKKSRFHTPDKPDPKTNSVAAVVHGQQEVRNGSALKMRLSEDLLTSDGHIIRKNTYLFGKVTLSGERMIIKIESVRLEDKILPLKLQVYDWDGMIGINVPHSIKAAAVQEATQEGINEVRMPYSTNILETGISAVAEAGKSVVGKQTRIIKVTVKSNYKIYLHDEKN